MKIKSLLATIIVNTRKQDTILWPKQNYYSPGVDGSNTLSNCSCLLKKSTAIEVKSKDYLNILKRA
jgi:hypothetical protein